MDKTICIIGPGRSGTSLLTRLLNQVGVDLGSDQGLARPQTYNPTGNWEHSGFYDLNAQVLRLLGCSVNVPPRLDLAEDWPRHPAFDPLRDKARQIIDTEFSRSSIWGWKDPKTSLTLPFWHTLLPDMDHLICLRNPLDMAASFRSTSGYPWKRCYSVCLLYTLACLRHTEGKPRLFVFYEDLLRNWRCERERLIRHLGLPRPSPDDEDGTQCTVRPDLRHHVSTIQDMMASDTILPELKMLYLGLYTHVGAERRGVSADVQPLAEPEPVPKALLESAWRDYSDRAPIVTRLWYRAVRNATIVQRRRRGYYALNRFFEVLGQTGYWGLVEMTSRRWKARRPADR